MKPEYFDRKSMVIAYVFSILDFVTMKLKWDTPTLLDEKHCNLAMELEEIGWEPRPEEIDSIFAALQLMSAHMGQLIKSAEQLFIYDQVGGNA